MNIDLETCILTFFIGFVIYLLVNRVFMVEGVTDKKDGVSCINPPPNTCFPKEKKTQCLDTKPGVWSCGVDRDRCKGPTQVWCESPSPSPPGGGGGGGGGEEEGGECVCAFEKIDGGCIDYANQVGAARMRRKELCNKRNKENCYFDENTDYVGEGTCIWNTGETKIPPEIDCEKLSTGQCLILNEYGFNQCHSLGKFGHCVPQEKYDNYDTCMFQESCKSGYCDSGYCKPKSNNGKECELDESCISGICDWSDGNESGICVDGIDCKYEYSACWAAAGGCYKYLKYYTPAFGNGECPIDYLAVLRTGV